MKSLQAAIKLIQREAYEKYPPGEYLWVRLDPGGEAENFDHISSAIEWLGDLGINQIDKWFTSGKTAVTGFTCGEDTIYVYWGDEESNLVRGVNEKEMREIGNRLEGNVDVEADFAQQDVSVTDSPTQNWL